MSSANQLVDLFGAMTANISHDRANINKLDHDDGDTGDNMAANFQLVTDTLAQQMQQGGAQANIGAALAAAAAALTQQGQGATAPIYARGLLDAAGRLQGKQGFSVADLLPLLQGLLSGAQQASGTQPGNGSMMDVLVPAITTFMSAKQQGASDADAFLETLLVLRRSAVSTAGSGQGYGRSAGRNTQGQIDPGAAGTASVLEGLFGSLLRGALKGK